MAAPTGPPSRPDQAPGEQANARPNRTHVAFLLDLHLPAGVSDDQPFLSRD